MKKTKSIVWVFVYLITLILSGCNFDSEYKHYTVNDCIKNTNQDYDKIINLVCNPGKDTAFDSEDYDLLRNLSNLESVKFIGIGSEETAQLFFDELTKLPKLHTVEICDSKVGKIQKLSRVKKLSTLSIELQQGSWYKIDDYHLFSEKGNFDNLETLKLDDPQLKDFPDLTGLIRLKSLQFTNPNVKSLSFEDANWANLTSLDLTYTKVSSIDGRIINELRNLKVLNISGTQITNLKFVLKLPSLTDFTFNRRDEEKDIDMDILKAHPNFKETWLK